MRVSTDHMYSVCKGPHIPPLNERHLQVNRSGNVILFCSIYSPVYLPWQQNAVFVEELRVLAPFPTARTFASHILTTLVRVCVRRGGGVGAGQSITPETRSTLWGLKMQQYVCLCMCMCVCAYMCCHGCMARLVQACVSMRQTE